MSNWLNNLSAKVFVTIKDADGNDVDYSNQLIQGQITDSSVAASGAVFTGGTLIFRDLPGQSELEDYAKNRFGRGRIVLIDVEIAGTRRRHPRGFMRIIDSSYNMETREMSLDVGCILTLHNLTNEITNRVSGFASFNLPEDAGFTELIAGIQGKGNFLWACLLYTSPSPRDATLSRMPSSA